MDALDWLRNSWYQLDTYMRTGGIVMWPLAAVSLAMWLLIVERTLFIRRLHRRPIGFHEAWEHVRDGRLPDAKTSGGAVALLVSRFIPAQSGNRRLDRFILDETVMRLNHSLTDHLDAIGVLAAVAPLLGLLGTVTGMITTFDVLAVFGTGNAKAMAGGISEALITTETGLLVAIPGLYMKGFLDRRARNLGKRITAAGLYLQRRL
ncbi:MAG: TolQ2 [uncultured bacterium]|nr:MAG: TolQ2 [uncultured bacterium]